MKPLSIFLLLALPFFTCSCWTRDNRPIRPVDRSKPLPKEGMWRRIDGDPPSYVPKPWPVHMSPTAQRGEWLSDPQDGTRYFVPKSACGGMASGVWRGTAKSCMNKYSKEEHLRRNGLTILIGMPLEFLVLTLSSMGGTPAYPVESYPNMYLATPKANVE
jgi:hypothetical protein